LDGTLTDPAPGILHSLRYALSYFGLSATDEKLLPFIGPPLKSSFMEFFDFSAAQADKAVEKYREHYVKTGLFENRLTAGIIPLLSDLRHAGKYMAIASSKPLVFVKTVAGHFGIASYFDVIFGSELDGTYADKAALITYALQKIAPVDKEKTVMIGDRMHDTLGAKENGIDSIGVLFGYGSEEELLTHGATYLAKDAGELRELLL
jgi:phosphoglycolate phosphatase